MMNNNGFRLVWIGICAAVVCAPLGTSSQANAAMMITNDLQTDEYQFKFTLAAKRDLLAYPGNETVAHMASWDSPNGLMMARNTPYIELENTSQTANIESFTMTVGDPGYFFDFVQSVEMPGGINFVATLLSPDAIDDGVGSSVIHFEFENFAPGAVLRFQTQLHPLSSDLFNYPDFRQVLFDLNGASDLDNSLLSVAFSEPGKPQVVVQHLLEDYHSDMPTVLGVGYRAYGEMDSLTLFGAKAGDTPSVPEPNTFLLCCLGVACLARRSSSRLG